MRLLIVLLCLLALACGQAYSPSQAEPVSANQAYMVSEMKRMEPMLGMGEFIAIFTKPPVSTYAGWVACDPGGRAPWYVNFNETFVETLAGKEQYMSALVAHEMCHHWVVNRDRGGCHDEMAAEICAFNLVTYGRPK